MQFQKYQQPVALNSSASSPIRLVSEVGEDLDGWIVFVRVLPHGVYSEERFERFVADHEM